MNLGLAGKGCVVTGASSGIGLATAKALCAEDAAVLLVARNEDRLRAAAGECAAAGGRADWLAIDATAPDAGERLVDEAERRFGSLDVVVNNAGTSAVKPIDELTDDDWQLQWELHVMGPMRLMRAAAPRMAERGFGRIVNVCSSSGKRPSLTNPAYSVTKAAQLSLSRLFADLHAGSGVLVNAVAPGPVESPLWMAAGGLADQAAKARGITRDEALAQQRSKVPVGRFGTTEEIAAVVAFLCSEQASYVEGSAWSVDGGAVAVII
jgi:3-oxoacyl-[acyl-carrier protein] reductase